MKRLLQKKWFRVLARTAVGGITLVVLGYAFLNWWAAGKKRSALAEARAAGIPLTVTELTAGMPPDHQNFARTGIMRRWEDAYAEPWATRSSAATTTIESFRSMGNEELRRALSRNRKNPSAATDFSFLPDDGSYGKTAGSFLAEFDRRHGAVLEELKAGFGLPHVRRPVVPDGFPGGVAWMDLAEGFGLESRRAQDGLGLRAEAALVTGDSAKAAESIEMMARLGDAIGSRKLMVPVLVEFFSLRGIKKPLKIGIERQQWRREDLDRISNALARCDIRQRVKQGIECEILWIQAWEGWKKDRQRFVPQLQVAISGGTEATTLNWLLDKGRSLLPSGFFDLCAAGCVGQTLRSSRVAALPGPVREWWNEAETMRQAYDATGKLGQMIDGYPGGAPMLKRGARALVDLQLCQAACAIERHRLEHGSYPETLDGFAPAVVTDPFHGTPFRYGRKDGTFFLYSMGPNGNDDGGAEGIGRRADDADWVW